MRARRLALSLALALAVVRCGGDNGGTANSPVPGTLGLSLESPNNDDGAVLVTVTGGPIDGVVAAGYQTYSSQVDANTRRIVVVGNLVSGVLVRIQVPDLSRKASYIVTVQQVAERGTYALRSLPQYSVAVIP